MADLLGAYPPVARISTVWLSTKPRAAVCAGPMVGVGSWHHISHSREKTVLLGKIKPLALTALAKGSNKGRCRELRRVAA